MIPVRESSQRLLLKKLLVLKNPSKDTVSAIFVTNGGHDDPSGFL